jgi:histidyl-tRNA synthetase
MNAILESVNIENKREVMRELDKIDKLGEDAVKTGLKRYADANQILTLFKLLEKDLEFFVKNLFDGADELFKLQVLCKNYGFSIQFSPFLLRGLSYYTGNVFEVKVKDTKNSMD